MKPVQTLSLALILLLALCLLAGCGSSKTTAEPAGSASAETPSPAAELVMPDLSDTVRPGSADETDAIPIVLSDESGSLTVTEAGTYLLSGTLSDGQILVDAPEDAKVRLILNGVSVSKQGHAAVYAVSADKLILSAAAGSVNRLSSAGAFVRTDGSNVDAAVFARCDLTLNGEGTLDVVCEAGHGVACKDDLKLKGAAVNIRAAKKGMEGKDSLVVEGGALAVEAGAKGLWSGDDEDAEAGLIRICGGSVSILSRDDAIHSNNSVSIEGGTLVLETGDDAVHADAALTVSGGSLSVTKSYEGLEARVIDISGGEIRILASDDGLNASGGQDSSQARGPFGGDPFHTDPDAGVTIRGGRLFVNAEGDGIDSNGLLQVSGGEVYVSGPTRGGNGALDFGTQGVVTGGTVVAAGSADMAENFGVGSTQGSILLNVGSQPAGAAVCVTDENGTVLVSYAPEKSYQSVVVSCPGLQAGKRYTVTAGSFSQTVDLTELIYGSGMGMGGPGMGGFPGGGPGDPGGGPGGQGGFPGGQGGRPGGRP